jgi:tetratricopeptide (TPR) repeat protein
MVTIPLAASSSSSASTPRPARPASLDPLVVPFELEASDIATYPYDLGKCTRPIRTSSPAAQIWFDRGLTWTWAFNHEEAVRCFQRALLEDPTCSMAYFGVSYANGGNYNRPFQLRSKEELPGLLAACVRAAELAVQHATDPLERALAEALLLRYPAEPTPTAAELKHCTRLWGDAMRDVYARYGDDLDVAAIYADSRMNLAPWQLWDIPTGKPNVDAHTLEIRDVLARALVDPRSHTHAGVLHLWIHLMELSPTPELAIVPGDRIRDLVPSSGHLRHMPSHIDIVTGDYRRAIASNAQAIVADREYERFTDDSDFYAIYRTHNAEFLVYAALFSGQLEVARAGVDEIERILSDRLLRLGDNADWFETFRADRAHILVRFGRWDELLALPIPADQVLFAVTTATLRYARGVAYAVLGHVAKAEEEQRLFRAACAAVPATRMAYPNSAHSILAVGESMLAGELDYRKGNFDAAFVHLREAVRRSDNLVYAEPWGWMQPPRHALAALLLEQGHVEDAAAVYAADLGFDATLPRAHWHPRNVWALHGYHECLRKLGQPALANIVKADLDIALAVADVEIRSSCYCRKAELACCT